MTDSVDKSPSSGLHGLGPASGWVQRWSHLVAPKGTILDLACGAGRHMKWFAEKGHPVTGVDRSPDAIQAAGVYGEAVVADIENAPWPLTADMQTRTFDAIVVTNYLWRPLYSKILESLAHEGVLIYETFAMGNETVGKPSRPDFLLQPGELLTAFGSLRVVAFEDGFVDNPPRFLQRIVAVKRALPVVTDPTSRRYLL